MAGSPTKEDHQVASGSPSEEEIPMAVPPARARTVQKPKEDAVGKTRPDAAVLKDYVGPGRKLKENISFADGFGAAIGRLFG